MLFFVALTDALAQRTSSAYSAIGPGLLNGNQNAYHEGMGGLGLSNSTPWIMSNVNPAFLPLNNFTMFDIGITVESRNISSDTLSESLSTGTIDYFALAVPVVAGKLGIALGVRPYTTVNYAVRSVGQIDGPGNNAEYIYSGEGGMSRAYLNAGLKVWKNLYAGASASYIFGSKTENTTITIGQNSNVNTALLTAAHYRSTRFSDFNFSGSLGYKQELKNRISLSAGILYDLEASLNTFRSERLEGRRSLDFPVLADTLADDLPARTILPSRIGGGVSIQKMFNWTFGVDIYYQDWSKYRNFENSNEGLAENLKIIVGGEYIPDYASVSSYFKRVSYLFGFNYEKTPIVINNIQVDDIGITFGASLPVGGASAVNLSGRVGQMGFNNSSLVQETYFRITMGISFNDRSYGWYRNQRKFN
ncbi:MAG: hypothetical protein JJU28_13715 [Cyclobacteriaceae bacterium]|nr:hypothetical protein [Cyclobacteriaceae bacterium]